MKQSSGVVLSLLPWLAASSPLAAQSSKPVDGPVANSNHIFNAIHDSMRQWGSSLNHNGMSMFIATVPEDTELYHGTNTKYRVNGTQWLAFEPEHAMMFARPGIGGPGGHGRRPGKGAGKGPGRHGPPGSGPPGSGLPVSEQAHDMDTESNASHNDGPKVDGPFHCGQWSYAGLPPFDHEDFTPPTFHHERPPPPPFDDKDDMHPFSHRPPPPPPPPSHHRGKPDFHHGPPPPPPLPGGDHRGSPDFGDGLPLPTPPPGRPSGHHSAGGGKGLGWFFGRPGDRLRNPKKRDAAPLTTLRERIGSALAQLFGEQESLNNQDDVAENDDDESLSGYFHTYRTRHDLRLLYLDGQSAAKSDKGTLDVQDIVIVGQDYTGKPMSGEMDRAKQMCKTAHEEWDDKIDGVIRMEGGFEIILCSFADHLDVVKIAQAQPHGDGPPGHGSDGGYTYYRAVAARYWGIGGNRVKLDYDNFVSLFALPRTIYWDDINRPRVNNDSAGVELAQKELSAMILEPSKDAQMTDWQAVTDMIVERYADRIAYMTSGELKTLNKLNAELENALRPFFDYSNRNGTIEAERCASQFLPAGADHETMAARAVRQVSSTLCSTLTNALAADSYSETLDKLKDLKDYLAWSDWKKCRGCAVHEVCFIPIWPMGTAEDFEEPKCRSDLGGMGPGGHDQNSYWGGMGPPPGQDDDEKKSDVGGRGPE